MQLAMGISIGVVLALLIGVLLFLVRKRPERIKKVLGSFIRTHRGLLPALTAPASVALAGTEMKLALKIFFGTYSWFCHCTRSWPLCAEFTACIAAHCVLFVFGRGA